MVAASAGMQCAVCREPLRRKPAGEPGPAATCRSHACRQAAYRERHALGWRLFPDQPSALELLRELGVPGA